MVDQIPSMEGDSGVFSASGGNSAGSHPNTPRSVGPYSPGAFHSQGFPGAGPPGAGPFQQPQPPSAPSFGAPSDSNAPAGAFGGIQSTLGFETLDKAAALGLATATPLTDLRQYINSDLGFSDLEI